jgi:phenylacetate-coenzyme A ligase PaaK-like adenylate-forming protein
LNTSVKSTIQEENIWAVSAENFSSLALDIFHFQYQNNPVYRRYCDTLGIVPRKVETLTQIPYLPIQFFKSHEVTSTQFVPEAIFESSGTTQSNTSRHLVKSLATYETSFNKAFRIFYGEPSDWCIIGLLPSYLERTNSSLVMMVDKLIQQTGKQESGFYLNEFQQLQGALQQLEQQQQKTLVIGVTFALLDFADGYGMPLQHTTIMETGGMKGRRQEITRQQVHEQLCARFGLQKIHSEYGMTELLSQAYSAGDGIFTCPPWMKILLREEDDPFSINLPREKVINGAVNVIDLANLYSCSFIATDDAAKLYPGGGFEILGRLDNSDTRGCSLLAL